MHTLLDVRVADAQRPEMVFGYFQRGGVETAITRGKLWREAARHAHLLRSRGVRCGEVVLIILPHGPELLYAFLGAMLAGAIPSFMPPPSAKQDARLYWSAHEKLFDRLQGAALLSTREYLTAVSQNIPRLALRLVDATHAGSHPPLSEVAVPSPDDVALLQHSSGTTGLKKGVALSHRAVLTQLASYREALALRADDCVVSWLPLYHDMGLIACFLLPLVTGVPVVMLDPFEWVVNPRLLFDAIKRHRGTLCWQPNFAFHHLARTVRVTPELDVASMRIWNDCSEPCRAETLEGFARTFSRAGVKPEQLQVCYAMAETVFAVTQTAPGARPAVLAVDAEVLRAERRVQVAADGAAGAQRLLSVGRVISGLQVRIVDDAGQALPEGRVGGIAISGACLFDGYFKLPDETRRKLNDGWYQTGDLGFRYDGELYVTGRVNDLIIVHGKNFYAHELEFLVNQVPGVHPGRNVAVGWFRPEIGSEDVVLIAEQSTDVKVERSTLVPAIKQAVLNQTGLLVFDVHVVPPGWLVKTTSGKISRQENLGKYLADVGRAAAA